MTGKPRVLHADRIQSAISALAPTALVASWRRSSVRYLLDPNVTKPPQRLTAAELRQAHERAGPLLHAAQSSLDRLYAAVGDIGCCVLLADIDGVPVDRRGAAADDNAFGRWGLWTGAIWSEAQEGTNGIGTCLVEQRPLTIHRDQHFHARNVALSCTAAPVYDHEGRLVAALNVSSCRADLTEGFVKLISIAVIDSARRIEEGHFRSMFPLARIVMVAAPDRASGGLIAIDGDDLVIGATRSARLAFKNTDQQLREALPAADLLGDRQELRDGLVDAQRNTIQRALAHTRGNVSAAAAELGISRATLHRKLKRLKPGRPQQPD
ncbi:MAG: Fis family transcriptional regulator [Tardiphaga sp.]|nr:Fis family transcriptional regulator [Tardiphaga sp.]